MRLQYKDIARDGNGIIISDANIAVYLGGTTTAANVYTSSTSTTAVNSVTSGSDGSFVFYVDALEYGNDQTYKIVLTATINGIDLNSYSIDNIKVKDVVLGSYTVSSAKTVSSNIKIPSGVTYVKSGSGSMSFDDKFEAGDYQVFDGFSASDITGLREINPIWFGCKGDGTTDDTAHLQSAINSAVSQNIPIILRSSYLTTGVTVTSASSGFSIIGNNGAIKVSGNNIGLTITGSEGVEVRGIHFTASALGANPQTGINIVNSSRIKIYDNRFDNFFLGINWTSSATGLATGAYPIPSIISRNIMKACAGAIFLDEAAEYISINNNIINDSTAYAITTYAGNFKICDNEITGNLVGIVVAGGISANSDHGDIVGNTINHNSSAGIVVTNLSYSLLISSNDIWAQILSNYGAAPIDSSYGLLMANVKNVVITSNVFGINKVNIGLNGTMTDCIIVGNTFKANNTYTSYNYVEYVPTLMSDGNKFGLNTFEGTLVGGADNNDPNKVFTPSLLNSWVDLGTGFQTAGYYRDSDNVVHLKGVVKSGTIGQIIFILPANYRPALSVVFPVISNDLFGKCLIDSSGEVYAQAGDTTYFSLDGISFLAEK